VTLRGVFGSYVLLSRFVILVVALDGFVKLALSFAPQENPWFPRKVALLRSCNLRVLRYSNNGSERPELD